MHTTIIKKVKAKDLEYIFDNMSDICYIKFYQGQDIKDSDFNDENIYTYKINIRHNDNEEAEENFNKALEKLNK